MSTSAYSFCQPIEPPPLYKIDFLNHSQTRNIYNQTTDPVPHGVFNLALLHRRALLFVAGVPMKRQRGPIFGSQSGRRGGFQLVDKSCNISGLPP